MDMSALNFCAFATCVDYWTETTNDNANNGLLVASPNGLGDGSVDVFQLPTQRRVSQLPSEKSRNTGMVMAITIVCPEESRSLRLISGYEDGQVMVHTHQGHYGSPAGKWIRSMTCKAHSQPVLSLDLSPAKDYFITSSADANIAKFEMPGSFTTTNAITAPVKTSKTKHAGQQGLSIRSDGKIFATAGWDSRVRVYSAKTLRELAVLKWHQDGCYSTAFADIVEKNESEHTQQLDSQSKELANMSALDMIKRERGLKAQSMHWLAAGGKDGKISLWDIY